MQPTWFFSSLLALRVGFPLLAQAAETSALHAAFARPQQLVDIGGRKLNLYCSGDGATTVLFDAPFGESGWSWFKVQPEVARHTRACVYDRAGLGFSDAAARPNTSANAVEDLHDALTAGGIKPPYLLVGNSLGGENAQVFTYRYPAEGPGAGRAADGRPDCTHGQHHGRQDHAILCDGETAGCVDSGRAARRRRAGGPRSARANQVA
jgi:pimeloyl-ACP methyl ester carboxylesterase